MKVGILTFQSANNYGAFLQAFALCNTLNSFNGVSAEIIDYICPAIENDYDPKKILHRNGNKLKNFIAYLLRKNQIKNTATVFEQSRKKYFTTYHNRVSREEIAHIEDDIDLFIVGSDQVWNFAITENDYTYFLDFIQNHKKKASYAASMGKASINDNEILQIKEYLASFTHLSLREADSARLVSSLLKRDDVVTSIDPVFLLSSSEWREYVTAPKEKNYLLYYSVGFPMKTTLDYAQELAKRMHKKLLLLMDKDVSYKYVTTTHLHNIGPMDFVSYIYYADVIVTNSFHATAFSILFHKTFYVETVVKRRERIVNLLNVAGLEGRSLVNGKSEFAETQTDWHDVDENIKPWIDASINYLKNITDEH